MTENSKYFSAEPARTVFDAAVQYAKKDYAVFPLYPDSKRPRTVTGFHEASRDYAKIESWFMDSPDLNIGIATGSGILVFDLDIKNGAKGIESLAELEAEFGKLPVTLTCTTTSGGKHFYFKYNTTSSVKSRIGLRPGLDVKAKGGYVVAPPSVIDGKPYVWDDASVRVAPAPQWLLDIISKPTPKPKLEKASLPTAKIETGTRNDTLVRAAGRLMRKGRDQATVTDMILDLNDASCEPPLDKAEVVQIVVNIFELYANKVRAHLTDKGNAEKMAEMYRGRIRYVMQKKQWLEWNGNLWQSVDETRIYALAKTVSVAWHVDAEKEIDEAAQTALREHAYKTEGLMKMQYMIQLFKSEDGIATSASDLDNQAMLLPVENGIVDLQTGALLPADPDLLITHGAYVTYDPTAKCPLWEKFLLSVMDGDEDLVDFLHRALGYNLTTSVAEGVVMFLYGFGANGKSTFLNIVRALMGDLGTQATGETLIEGTRSSSGPSSDIARLHGKRFVAISEIDAGKHLAEARLKSLTGNDAVTARFLYSNEFTFVPQMKIWVATNHKPVVKNNDYAIWRRIVLIPFEVKFKKSEQDRGLEKKLLAELPGILNWMIEGCKEWRLNGLQAPQSIERATNEYRNDQDIIGLWETEECVVGHNFEGKFSDLFESFNFWVKDHLQVTFSKHRFGSQLLERGYTRYSRPARYYKGLELRTAVSPEAAARYDEKIAYVKRLGDVSMQTKEWNVNPEDDLTIPIEDFEGLDDDFIGLEEDYDSFEVDKDGLEDDAVDPEGDANKPDA